MTEQKKKREKYCRASQFTLAKLNESLPWQNCSNRLQNERAKFSENVF